MMPIFGTERLLSAVGEVVLNSFRHSSDRQSDDPSTYPFRIVWGDVAKKTLNRRFRGLAPNLNPAPTFLMLLMSPKLFFAIPEFLCDTLPLCDFA
jgi:hypothetical protein